jgi:ABC-type antimicrobial peptide transport system permease subunit
VKLGVLGTLVVTDDGTDVPVPGLGAALAGVVAALLPARRAARIDVLKAVASS